MEIVTWSGVFDIKVLPHECHLAAVAFSLETVPVRDLFLDYAPSGESAKTLLNLST